MGQSLTSKGFTLIELLVVIAIIAILAAISLPVFNTVQARSHEVACASNLRQIGVALTVYATEHDGSFPTTTGSYWGSQPTLIAALAPYLGQNKLVWFCRRQINAARWNAEALYDAGSIGYYYWAWKGNAFQSDPLTDTSVPLESPWISQGWNPDVPGLVLMSDLFGDKNAWGTPQDVQYHAGVSTSKALTRPGSNVLLSGGAVLKFAPKKQ